MNLFMTWSGPTSKAIANGLRNFIPTIIQSIVPFMSETDVEKGTRWESEIVGKLESADLGIICLTRDNLTAPWLLFEAGALSRKAKAQGVRVYTYLHEIEPHDIKPPLSMFQH